MKYKKYMKISTCLFVSLYLFGCEKTPEEKLNELASKMEFDGIYVVSNSPQEKFTALVNREEDSEYACKIGKTGPPCGKKVYGFKRDYFDLTLTEKELNDSSLYVKYTKSAEDFNIKMGIAGITNDKYGKESWKTHYCHVTEWSLSSPCIGGNSGRRDVVTTFRVKKVKEGLFKFKPIKKIKKGRYFFWLQTSKSSGFTQGYPLEVI